MMGVALEEDKIREHSLVKGHPWAGRGVGKKPRKKEKKKKHVYAVPRGAKISAKPEGLRSRTNAFSAKVGKSGKIRGRWSGGGKLEPSIPEPESARARASTLTSHANATRSSLKRVPAFLPH